MIIKKKSKPRIFSVGKKGYIKIKDMGTIKLKSNEQITLLHKRDEFDITKKNWGFYATPSVNDRLKRNNFLTALVKNLNNQYYIMVVHSSKRKEFKEYLLKENNKVVKWLSNFKLKKNKNV